MLYIIIGASLSGKTSVRLALQQKFGFGGLDTDTLRTMSEQLLPNMGTSHTATPRQNYDCLSPVVDAFLYARTFFPNQDYILEGDAINMASVVKQHICAKTVVIGYPYAKPKRIFKRLILTRNSSHWSCGMNQKEILLKIAGFIEFSKFLKTESGRYGFSFIDSDQVDIKLLVELVELEFGLKEPGPNSTLDQH